MIVRVLDFETTGEPPDAAVCEAAWCDVVAGETRAVLAPVATLVDPQRPMTPAARGVHHISDQQVAGAPLFGAVRERILEGRPEAIAAHRADFEAFFLGEIGLPIIDTWKVALRLWPDAPDHKNQTLRYLLGFDDAIEGFSRNAMPPHRAAPDAFVTAHILCRALNFATLGEMIEWSKEPPLFKFIPFGKHRGSLWAEVPADYLDWIATKATELDEDAKWNARRELKRRLDERREAFLAKAAADVITLTTVTDLETWWQSTARIRSDLGIERETDIFNRLVAICTSRKAVLSAPAEAA